jgi:electron transport complex protein RnfG
MNEFREGKVAPTLVLFAICLVSTFLLAFTYNVTAPAIEAQRVVLGGEGFVEMNPDQLPPGVTEAHMADDGSGFVIRAVSRGFAGPVEFIVELDAAGNYTSIVMSDHKETPGLGDLIANQRYLGRFYGHRDPRSVDAISGATM